MEDPEPRLESGSTAELCGLSSLTSDLTCRVPTKAISNSQSSTSSFLLLVLLSFVHSDLMLFLLPLPFRMRIRVVEL